MSSNKAFFAATGFIGDLPEGTKAIDASGMTAMPALMDVHTHISNYSMDWKQYSAWDEDNIAKILLLDEVLGSLERGKVADILIVDANPSVDISDTRNVEYVIKDGKLIDRKSLRR